MQQPATFAAETITKQQFKVRFVSDQTLQIASIEFEASRKAPTELTKVLDVSLWGEVAAYLFHRALYDFSSESSMGWV
jgi:hypothetical protein